MATTDKVENPSAFPREDYQADDAPGQRGMTLRDYFAGQALAGMLADSVKGAPAVFAAAAYEIADAMLSTRGSNQ